MTAPSTPDRTEGGAVLVLTALLLVVLMGMAALAIDAANAWSTKRLAQNNADMAALSAVIEIPHTFVDIPTIVGAGVQGEVSRIAAANGCTAPCLASSTLSTDYTSVEVDVSTQSDNAFAPAAGGDDSFGIAASATATIQINTPTIPYVTPFGMRNLSSDHLRCYAVAPGACASFSAAVQGADTHDPKRAEAKDGDLHVIPMRRTDTPEQCQNRDQTTIGNLRNGAQRLVDVASTGIRDEYDACHHAAKFGHLLTMPTQSQFIENPDLGAGTRLGDHVLREGLASRMGSSDFLWDHLPDGSTGECENAFFDDPANDFLAKTAQMFYCMRDTPTFNFSGSESRLGWAIRVNRTGSGGGCCWQYAGYHLVWLHSATYMPDTHQGTISGGSNVGAVGVFVISPGSVSSGLLQPDPGGIDNLDFELTD